MSISITPPMSINLSITPANTGANTCDTELARERIPLVRKYCDFGTSIVVAAV